MDWGLEGWPEAGEQTPPEQSELWEYVEDRPISGTAKPSKDRYDSSKSKFDQGQTPLGRQRDSFHETTDPFRY